VNFVGDIPICQDRPWTIYSETKKSVDDPAKRIESKGSRLDGPELLRRESYCRTAICV